MNLAVDIGNTQVKVGWFEADRLHRQDRRHNVPNLLSLIEQAETPDAIIVSSVAGEVSATRWLQQYGVPLVVLDGRTPLPFFNNYHTPATLGTDRIAAVAGAQQQHPGQNVLVIDVGTCITYDVITREAQYQGGLISPGVRMRLRAMHTFTARLPLVELTDEVPEQDGAFSGSLSLVEKSTAGGLRSGAVRGAAAEINQMIRMYADKFSDLHVVLCGGDAPYLLTYLYQDLPVAESFFNVVPELILIGLNSILQHNVNQKN